MRENSIIKKRILQYLEFKGISKYEFYQKTGVSNGVLSQKNGLSEDNIMKLLSYYRDININWLISGEGEMLKANLMAEASNKVSEPERKPPDDKDQMIIELQQHRITSLEKDLKEREREIDQLKKELKTAYDRSVVR